MRQALIVFVMMVMLAACGSGGSDPVEIIAEPTFPVSIRNSVYYGDSISFICAPHTDGISRAIPGLRSWELLPLVEHYAEIDVDTTYYILIGITDTWFLDTEDYYIQNMRKIFDILEGGAVNIISILPTDGIWTENNRIRNINQMLEALTLHYGFNFIDAYSEFEINGVLNPFHTSDGLHLNGPGCQKFYNILRRG
jgi:lysophospholipase L1-like esterase